MYSILSRKMRNVQRRMHLHIKRPLQCKPQDMLPHSGKKQSMVQGHGVCHGSKDVSLQAAEGSSQKAPRRATCFGLYATHLTCVVFGMVQTRGPMLLLHRRTEPGTVDVAIISPSGLH
jgi:hypothetical protein